ncbi:MAG TPA: non-canonical purine NTP pyrophosphatase [Rubrobacter sp.]|nr:non-canonical purine NTP pyrophosphatase [Rubrobacter sp.]
MKAIFVTTNEHKRREVQEILGVELERADLDLPEIQAIDPAEVATEKARAAREVLGKPGLPVLVEDSGLMVDAWDGFPGALTKWLMQSVGNDGMLRMLGSDDDRSARAVCVVALVEADGTVRTFRGEVRGILAPEPRGEGGFGYDPVFVPEWSSLTYAEMGEGKNTDSHRARAFRAVRRWLEEA